MITVAGTNGKGSTVIALDALLRGHGWRVGRYMSPHLLDFRERACLDGQMYSAVQWLQALDRVAAHQDGVRLSYFEVSTLAALHLLMHSDLDAWVLEVGLGGRLDAVNIIDPDVAVITSIGLDHVEYLGATRELIAREKAGILRAGRPCFIGDSDPPLSLREAVSRLAAPAMWLCDEARIVSRPQDWDLYAGPQAWQHLPRPRLAVENVALALAALPALIAEPSRAAVDQAMQEMQLAGRMQTWSQDARVLLDVAHNPHGAAFLCQQLKQQSVSGRVWVVIGMLADKDRIATVQALATVADGFYPCSLAVERGGRVEDLVKAIALCDVPCHGHFASPEQALAACRAQAASDDRIIVVGSFYTVAAILALDCQS